MEMNATINSSRTDIILYRIHVQGVFVAVKVGEHIIISMIVILLHYCCNGCKFLLHYLVT